MYDVNHDGKLDLIYGQGHGYGLYWLEQAGTSGVRKWIRHAIDESFSQSHALLLVDIDGDGAPELITGKCYRGHSGGDPGSYDPVVVYAYKLPTKAQFSGTTDPVFTHIGLSVNGTASAGTQIIAADLDHDGDIDLASAGKLGVHVPDNLKISSNVPKATREATQPLNRSWPFPGEGKEVEQEDGPTPTASWRKTDLQRLPSGVQVHTTGLTTRSISAWVEAQGSGRHLCGNHLGCLARAPPSITRFTGLLAVARARKSLIRSVSSVAGSPAAFRPVETRQSRALQVGKLLPIKAAWH